MNMALSILIMVLSINFLGECKNSFNIENGFIVDGDGRQRFFHGVNVIAKGPPYYPKLDSFDPILSLSDFDMKFLRGIGTNVIRLGVMWEAVEPIKGQYNFTYLNIMRKLVDKLYDQYQIYSIIDAHQDLYGAKVCGEGFPKWTYEPKNFPLPLSGHTFKKPIPTKKECWSEFLGAFYFSYDTSKAFQDLYGNTTITSKFIDFWEIVAKTFSSSNGVLGYELLNEPWCGDIWKDISLLNPKIADLKNLQPFYRKITDKISLIDNDTLIFFEPVTWSDGGTGFTRTPTKRNSKSVLSYHFYKLPQIVDWWYIEKMVSDSKRLRSGSFLTEFNIAMTSYNNTKSYVYRMQNVIEQCEKFQQSWTGWTYKPFQSVDWFQQFDMSIWYKNGTQNQIVVDALSRPYISIVNGVLIKSKYNTQNKAFRFKYKIGPKPGITKIFYGKTKAINITTSIPLISKHVYPFIFIKNSKNQSNIIVDVKIEESKII